MEISRALHSASLEREATVPRRPKQIVVSYRDIGERIKVLRQERGMTQVELARRLEITQSNLSAIERGARGVTVNQVVRLAKALGVSTDEILLAEKAPRPGRRPKKRLMQRLLRVQELSESDQRILLQLLEGLLMRHERKMARRTAKQTSKVA